MILQDALFQDQADEFEALDNGFLAAQLREQVLYMVSSYVVLMSWFDSIQVKILNL